MDYQLRGKLAFVTAGVHRIGEAIASLGDLRPESEPAQPDVEDATDGQPGAAVQGGGADSAKTRESRSVAEGQYRVAEKRYKELGGKITVLVTDGESHFRVSRKDPKPEVEFILSHQR